MTWLVIVLELAAGFALLGKGADWLVDGSASIARRFGVSTLVVGLTIVAFGTSAPEVVVSGLAAVQGDADLSIGNVLGSNVANVGLVLGASALVLPRVLESPLSAREVAWLFAALGLLWLLSLDRAITRGEAVLLLASFGAYCWHVVASSQRGEPVHAPDAPRGRLRHPAWTVVVGVASVALGAKLVVMGAEGGALALGVPGSVVGLTVLAFGTSLPELAAGVSGAFRGEADISLGNVVGSNVFNVLAVVGIVGLIQPLDPAHFAPEGRAGLAAAFADALREDFWVVLGFSVAGVLVPRLGGARFGRAKGGALVAAYVAYVVWLYASRG